MGPPPTAAAESPEAGTHVAIPAWAKPEPRTFPGATCPYTSSPQTSKSHPSPVTRAQYGAAEPRLKRSPHIFRQRLFAQARHPPLPWHCLGAHTGAGSTRHRSCVHRTELTGFGGWESPRRTRERPKSWIRTSDDLTSQE